VAFGIVSNLNYILWKLIPPAISDDLAQHPGGVMFAETRNRTNNIRDSACIYIGIDVG